jgi:hypothetical protein
MDDMTHVAILLVKAAAELPVVALNRSIATWVMSSISASADS